MDTDVKTLLKDIYSKVNIAKPDSVVRIDCENEEVFSIVGIAIRVGKIAAVIKSKGLIVDVALLDHYLQARLPVCSDCGEPLNTANDDLIEENPTSTEQTTIIFSPNEATIIVLMGALLSIAKSNGVFDDDNAFRGFLYNMIDCGVSDVERIPDIAKNQLLHLAKEMVSYHVKKNECIAKNQPEEKTGEENQGKF